ASARSRASGSSLFCNAFKSPLQNLRTEIYQHRVGAKHISPLQRKCPHNAKRFLPVVRSQLLGVLLTQLAVWLCTGIVLGAPQACRMILAADSAHIAVFAMSAGVDK